MHESLEVDPTIVLWYPLAQKVQLVDAFCEAYDPVEHGKHAELEAAPALLENVPVMQDVQLDEPVPDVYVPA